MKIEDIIDFLKKHFGSLNHIDYRVESNEPSIILAFNFCIINITDPDRTIISLLFTGNALIFNLFEIKTIY